MLKKVDGKYWALYGCYPSRAGYEAGDGGEGMAASADGVSWERVSPTVPVTPGGTPASPAWERRTVYQPFLVEHNGTYLDFYNAAGTNQYGASAEETGLRTLPVAAGLPGLCRWSGHGRSHGGASADLRGSRLLLEAPADSGAVGFP